MKTTQSKTLCLALAALLAGPSLAGAQCLDWSARFAQPGLSGSGYTAAVFDDGRGPALYVGGTFVFADQLHADRIARWDGTSWENLGTGLEPTAGIVSSVSSLAVFDDGSGPALYAAGSFDLAGGQPALNVARWDGASWTSVGTGIPGGVSALAVFDDGTGAALYAAGANVMRWDGVSWAQVGGGFSSSVSTLAVYDDGSGAKLYAGGLFLTVGSVPARRLARWDGSLWSEVGGGVGTTGFPNSGWVGTLAVYDDGQGPGLYVGGTFNEAGGIAAAHVARWDGATWAPLGSGLGLYVRALHVFDDGTGPELFAGGSFFGGLARWDGAAWSGVAGGGIAGSGFVSVYGMETFGGDLFVLGGFTSIGGMRARGAGRWDGLAFHELGSEGEGMDDPVNALTVFDDGNGPRLIAGGEFHRAGDTEAEHVALWNGLSWEALDGGTSDNVSALATFDDGGGEGLYVGGRFHQAGGQPAERIARWDGSAWSPLGAGMDYRVVALEVFDDGTGSALYATGEFTSAGGQPANYIARWDGASWSPLGTGLGLPGRVLAVHDDGSGPALFVGGDFMSAGGVAANRIARWDGSSWSALGAGMDFPVRALQVFDEGQGPQLYAGGSFTSAGGLSAPYLARWDGSGWWPLADPGHPIRALAVFDDGSGARLHAGGNFQVLSWDGSELTKVGEVGGDSVRALAVFDDGTGGSAALFAGGNFSGIGIPGTLGVDSPGIARWGADGTCPIVAYCTSGTSSSGCQALLQAQGQPSAGAGAGFELVAVQVQGDKDGLFFFGTSGRQASPWGNGTSYQCVLPPVSRGALLGGTGTPFTCEGVLLYDLATRWAVNPNQNPGTGAVVQAQLWYRDPANTSNQTTSLSNALEFVTLP